jgi:hypothetical protein
MNEDKSQMKEFVANKIYINETPQRFSGMQLGTRMTVIRMKNSALFLHSPTKLTPALKKRLDELGRVAIIVCPNKLHHLYVNSYVDNYPNAKIYAAPGLEKKRKDIQFNGVLSDDSNEDWREEIDQMVFRGCFFMKEIFFFHKETKTLIITDFIQSIHSYHNLFERVVGRVGGIYDNPSTPRDLRLMMRLDRQTVRQSIKRVKQWKFDKIIIAHGQLITRDAQVVFNKAFEWI